MAGYATGTQELKTAAQDILNVDESVQGVLRQLRGTIDGLSGVWAGAAAQAFNSLMQRFDDDAAKLQRALRDIAEQISGTADIYQQQEEEHSGSLGSISNRLG
ncbi:MAG TPA: WXG100 family type VII secretion target [Pseudonocardiaceae bacterium]|jgi:WXG100 family type VII secretion target|nr:WXG100 family type VII secretion target [Pseudonocardiaceae bacterium]